MSITALKQANNLSGTTIRAGSTLKIPGGSVAMDVKTHEKKTYRVRRGDTLYDISRAHDELGYKPEYDLDRGIADYLAALKQLGV